MHLRTFAATAAAATATAVAGGLASRNQSRSRWFAELRKPPYQPPAPAFGIVWPLIYTDIAAVSAQTLDTLRDRGDTTQSRAYALALASNLALNASWTWVFFNRHWLARSVIVATALAVSSTDLTRRAVAVGGRSAAPLALYPAWCSFASVLSGRIWLLNRRHH